MEEKELYCIDSERSTVGSVLIDSAVFSELDLVPNDFGLVRHQWIWEAFQTLYENGDGIDIQTVDAELKSKKRSTENCDFAYLTECEVKTPSAYNVQTYAKTVKGFAVRRELKQNADGAAKLVHAAIYDTSSDMSDSLHQAIQLLSPLDVSNETLKLTWASEAFEEEEPIDWLIKGLVTTGSVNLLYGNPGTGKTYSLLDAATCIATGKDWLDYPTTQGAVLILDWESGRKRLKKRLRECINGHETDKALPIAFEYMMDTNHDIRRLEDTHVLINTIKKHKFKFIIIDTFRASLRDGNENDSGETQAIFTNLRYIAETTDVAIFVIHHSNKSGGLRGSSAITGAADLAIQCIQSEGGINTFKVTKARDIALFNFKAQLYVKTDEYAYLLPTANTTNREKQETAILKVLANAKEPLSKNVINEKVTGGREVILKRVDGLVETEQIQQTLEGYILGGSNGSEPVQDKRTSGSRVSPP
jgi:archaellum biogenesis ATPase FlaH